MFQYHKKNILPYLQKKDHGMAIHATGKWEWRIMACMYMPPGIWPRHAMACTYMPPGGNGLNHNLYIIYCY